MNTNNQRVNQIHDRVWIGADLELRYAAEQIDNLRELGITSVIDVRIEADDTDLYRNTGIRAAHFGADDNGQDLSPAFWTAMLAYARNEFDNGETVLFHCHMGVNRGPSAGLAAVIDYFDIDPLDAWDAMQAARPRATGMYVPGYLRFAGRPVDAEILDMHIDQNLDWNMVQHIIADNHAAERREFIDDYRTTPVSPNERAVLEALIRNGSRPSRFAFRH